MKKMLKLLGALLLLVIVFQCGVLLADKQQLREDIIRLHVVANSDSKEDQAQKLLVRDAVAEYLKPMAAQVTDQAQAKSYLQERLSELETVANDVLRQSGANTGAVVTLQKEAFDTRKYDTFSLPAGVYESLRIEIGSGEGKNWWCVIFPSLCLPATSQGVQDTAVSAGFHNDLTDTLTGTEGYEIRFFFLDCLGKIENFFKS